MDRAAPGGADYPVDRGHQASAVGSRTRLKMVPYRPSPAPKLTQSQSTSPRRTTIQCACLPIMTSACRRIVAPSASKALTDWLLIHTTTRPRSFGKAGSATTVVGDIGEIGGFYTLFPRARGVPNFLLYGMVCAYRGVKITYFTDSTDGI